MRTDLKKGKEKTIFFWGKGEFDESTTRGEEKKKKSERGGGGRSQDKEERALGLPARERKTVKR